MATIFGAIKPMRFSKADGIPMNVSSQAPPAPPQAPAAPQAPVPAAAGGASMQQAPQQPVPKNQMATFKDFLTALMGRRLVLVGASFRTADENGISVSMNIKGGPHIHDKAMVFGERHEGCGFTIPFTKFPEKQIAVQPNADGFFKAQWVMVLHQFQNQYTAVCIYYNER